MAGWGRTSSSPRASPPTSDVLRKADVIGVANVGCEAAYGRADMTGMLCASDGSARGDACQGDSGGPLWSAAGAEPVLVGVLVGVVSWGIGCADPDYPRWM